MKCPSCEQGETDGGTTELSLEADGGRVSLVDVPAPWGAT